MSPAPEQLPAATATATTEDQTPEPQPLISAIARDLKRFAFKCEELRKQDKVTAVDVRRVLTNWVPQLFESMGRGIEAAMAMSSEAYEMGASAYALAQQQIVVETASAALDHLLSAADDLQALPDYDDAENQARLTRIRESVAEARDLLLGLEDDDGQDEDEDGPEDNSDDEEEEDNNDEEDNEEEEEEDDDVIVSAPPPPAPTA